MGPVLAALLLWSGPEGVPEAAEASVEPVAQRSVVFMVAEGDETGRSVVDAVKVQIADLEAELVLAELPASEQLRERLSAARTHAKAHDAVGVFWLEVEAEGTLLLHLVDPEGARMLVRRVEPSPESDTAAVQTVAVIARGFTSALLEGRSIGFYEVETEVTPGTDSETAPLTETRVTPTRPPRGELRLGAAYYGALVAPEEPWRWQSGVAVAGAWQWPIGIYVGLGYDVTQRFEATTASEIAGNTIEFEVRRNPIWTIFGYQHQWPKRRLALDVEARFGPDIHTSQQSTAVDDSLIRTDFTSIFLLLSPRASLHFRPVSYFSAFLSVGVEAVLRGSVFKAEFEDDEGNTIDEQTYLSPRVVRPLVLAGLNFYL